MNSGDFYGRSEVTRTPGILLPKQARYQLRYTPALLFYTLPLRKRSFGYYTILPEIVNHTGSKGRDRTVQEQPHGKKRALPSKLPRRAGGHPGTPENGPCPGWDTGHPRTCFVFKAPARPSAWPARRPPQWGRGRCTSPPGRRLRLWGRRSAPPWRSPAPASGPPSPPSAGRRS